MALVLNAIFNAASVHIASGASAECYRGTEDVRIIAIVVAPFKFCDIKGQIFCG
jgi:hypothetical protein